MEMELVRFMWAVREMRNKQRAYFRTRHPAAMREAIAAETLVDAWTKDIEVRNEHQGEGEQE